VVEPVNELLEAGERKLAAFSRFRHQAIAADVGARRMAQREYQPSGNNRPRHLGSFPTSSPRPDRSAAARHRYIRRAIARPSLYMLGYIDRRPVIERGV